MLFLKTCSERHDSICCSAHTLLCNHTSIFLKSTIPATSPLSPPLHICINCDISIADSKIPPMFSPLSSPAFMNKHLFGYTHPSDQHCLSPSKQRHTTQKCSAYYQRDMYLKSGCSRTVPILAHDLYKETKFKFSSSLQTLNFSFCSQHLLHSALIFKIFKQTTFHLQLCSLSLAASSLIPTHH